MENAVPITTNYDSTRAYPFLSSKFKRRDPNVHFYLPIECPLSKGCTDGTCPLAHTRLEIIFHPIVYKTRKCKMISMGSCGFPQKCAFYNNDSEKMAAQLLWLVWEKTWDLWRINIEAILGMHNKFVGSVIRMLPTIKNYRGNVGDFLRKLTNGHPGSTILDTALDHTLRNHFSRVRQNGPKPAWNTPSLSLLCSRYNPFHQASWFLPNTDDVFYEWFFNREVELMN
ncbi:erythrocyte membrane protein, putative [Babesia ovata]|uniref:Erythrocyte membrane protein, putative n=1 Tax=Babesia ovata TaxID=189622 RepID=A0A2H6KC07_9APIC|nr:erythrocyte membrane protein, putative [Babesia ovata]GBE60522.1 erythrocyte membrane protein, putative [Babesia ovata]